ncbi:glycosyltransferase family 4 protein [Faecalicatena contorta]|uniref:glycosyltransferase family 4 protein n=1 Tax=Faecalicatena contorta TaxID=39482 RepID=UPI001F279C39|nr:glycosyltransferase family 4 protein [Faecalicatena contorta]MCF2680717.1 glycosyltransferase family 4 protein [Faecalicatena contorta]
MKILHGMTEVAGQGYYSVKGLKENGIDAKMAIWKKNPFGYEYDYCVKVGTNKWLYPYYAFRMLVFAIYALFKFDCFHFHFGWTLIPGGYDLKILKIFNKKVFMEFHGSDIRWSFNRTKYEYIPLPEDSEQRKKRILKILKYVDGIILHDDELKKHLPDVEVPVYVVPLRMDISKFSPIYPEKEVSRPVIVHAPSKRGIKGTEYVLDAIKELGNEVEFILVENKTQKEAFELYKKADIIIDQLLAGTYGVFAIEAMALGKPVITYVDSTMAETFPEELPIVSANPENLLEKIKMLLADGSVRRDIGIQSRKYVEKYHDCRKNALILADIYQGKYPSLDGREAFKFTEK